MKYWKICSVKSKSQKICIYLMKTAICLKHTGMLNWQVETRQKTSECNFCVEVNMHCHYIVECEARLKERAKYLSLLKNHRTHNVRGVLKINVTCSLSLPPACIFDLFLPLAVIKFSFSSQVVRSFLSGWNFYGICIFGDDGISLLQHEHFNPSGYVRDT